MVAQTRAWNVKLDGNWDLGKSVSSLGFLSFADGVQRAALQLSQKEQLRQQLLHRVPKWWVRALTAVRNTEKEAGSAAAFLCLLPVQLSWEEPAYPASEPLLLLEELDFL